ncbi:hypothetical protein D3C72_1362180 [compost metagenome]
MLVQIGHQRQRFAKVHVTLAEIAQLAQAFQHLRQALFLFSRTAQLFGVSAHFHDVLVTNVDRHQRNRTRTAAQHRLNGHRQSTGFRIQKTARTGTPPFDEILNGIATAKQLAQIFAEHRGVELVAFEGTTNKERTQTAENRAGWPEIQVDTGRDVRWYQPLMIQHV